MSNTREENLLWTAGVWEMTGNIPSSKTAEETPMLVANNAARREILAAVQKFLKVGNIVEFETMHGKIMNGLFLTNEEWIAATKIIEPYFFTDERRQKLVKLRNSLEAVVA
jgi:hypothetical protein